MKNIVTVTAFVLPLSASAFWGGEYKDTIYDHNANKTASGALYGTSDSKAEGSFKMSVEASGKGFMDSELNSNVGDTVQLDGTNGGFGYY